MVKIATDSAADFEPDELKRLDVVYLPMSVYFGDRHYLENIDITKEQFFDMLETDPNFPKTSQPAPALFEDLFEEAKEAGDEVVYLPLSTGLSGDWQTAMSMKESVGYDGIYVIDTLTCTGGQRLMVEEAVRLRDEGKSGKEIADAMEEMKKHVEIFTVMDTLEYLYKNGRLSNVSYYIAVLGKIKPIMHCSVNSTGHAEIVSKHIGVKRAIEYVASRPEVMPPDPRFPIYVMYTKVKDNAYKLRERLIEKGFEIPEEHIVPVGAVVGAHIGANACAIAYVRK